MNAEVFGARLELTPSGGAYWQDHDAFLVADLHLGKGSSFRVLGQSPVPPGSTAASLEKLAADIERFRPRSLWILGDLWHRAEGCTPNIVEGFRDFLVSMRIEETLLVEGNHDVRTAELDSMLRLQRCERYVVDGLSLIHEPSDGDSPFLAGHLHPGVVLFGKGGQAMRRPCFHLSELGFVFPAYGDFTGCHQVDLQSEDKVFVLGSDQVHSLTGAEVLAAAPRPFRKKEKAQRGDRSLKPATGN